MGITLENVAHRFDVSGEDQNQVHSPHALQQRS